MKQMEIIRTVTQHMLTQGERALSARGGCVYHAEDGKSCAVGCLIPPPVDVSEYAEVIEIIDAIDECTDDNLLPLVPTKIFTLENEEILSYLQTVHDIKEHWKSPETMVHAVNLNVIKNPDGDIREGLEEISLDEFTVNPNWQGSNQ